jgi:hypothetical protein
MAGVFLFDQPDRKSLLHSKFQAPVPIGNSVLIETIDLLPSGSVICHVPMSTFFRLVFSFLHTSLRSRAALQAEILALRHQLLVLQRST